MRNLALPAFAALSLLASCVASPPALPPIRASAKLIHSVQDVTVRVMESHPEQIHVEARGEASSGGWTKPQLRAVSDPRPGGIYVLEFVAEPPEGIATQALTPISATTTFVKPKGFRGVEVIAQTNRKASTP